MKKLLIAMLCIAIHTQSVFCAEAKTAAARHADELEATRKGLEDAYGLLSSISADLKFPALIGGLRRNEAAQMKQQVDELHATLYWANADKNLQDAWSFLQKAMVDHTPLLPEGANPWEGFSEADWTKKEEIIASEPGQGTIWKINPEFGNFLVAYMKDYSDMNQYKPRNSLTGYVGQVVPSLYGSGLTKSKQTLQNVITNITNLAPDTGKILQAKFNKRFS